MPAAIAVATARAAASMRYLLPSAVLMLMLSIGMSLRPSDLVANWRRLTPGTWARLLLATFLLPPLVALGLGKILPLPLAATAGLFLIGIAPGAPLMTRNVARRGFDMQTAASYQVWGALMIPIMIPLLVAAAGQLYNRDIWIPPLTLLGLIARQQFLPLIAGMALMHFAPAFSTKVQRALNLVGNGILTAALVGLLWKLGPTLKETNPWVGVAALLMAISCLLISRALLSNKTPGVQTLVLSNVNRHVGLALLVAQQHLGNRATLPVIACYALLAPFVMAAYARIVHRTASNSIDTTKSTTHRIP